MPLIAPSLLSCNFLQLENECLMINKSQADWFHLDVMDGRFVPNISFGIPLVQHISKVATKPLDVHVMIEEPEKYVAAFKQAGATHYTFHIEACNHTHRTIQQIKENRMKAGVAINPHTPIYVLENVIEDIDIVCLMSVNPGFGGQQFILQTINKIKALKQLIQQTKSNALIQIDGGVTLSNAKEIIAAGADCLVAGNTIFASENPAKAIEDLKNM